MQPFLLLLGLAVVGVVVVLVLRHRQSEQRSLAESAFRDLADAMQLGITLSNRRGQIVYSNKADAELHGYEPEELLGKPSNVLGAPTARQTVGLTDMENFGSWKRDTLNARKDGEVFPVHLRSDVVRDQDGGLKGVITTCEDITERKRAEELEAHNALEEPLTGLANRTFFLELVNRAVKRSKRHPDYRFAVLYMDIERFRLINDSLGHDAGDALLIGMATVLQESIRPNDVAARIAGDEFALLLDAIGHVTDATRVADRIVQKLTTPFEYEGREVYLIPNIGIAVSAADRDDPEQYLKEASVAMTRVRDQGTERRFHVSDELIQRRATQRLRLETDLRKAIDQEELRAFYQPIVDLRSGEIAGFEALVRWTHGERGMISPGEFIPAAEETGLVVPIGSWMLREACRQLRDWQDRVEGYPNLNMNVNLSVRHLGQAGLLEEVSQVLEQTGLRADHLKLEVTESMLMENAAQQVDVLGELRELGVGVAIDDFGTGYSSLSYLQQFEIDSLKIDRSFLPQSKEDRDWDIVRMIISLAQNKSATVVAEGVETQEQLDQLRKLGCDRAQGFLFSKPLPSDEAEKLLKG